ncbi:RNA polymerase sigma factor [Telmatocola sphagniphila]|uniref:RNA polymerase sigma factor n=2 Tax=Telmatocola sphagniphila TaxID=1123043 RepID=A0A8E6BAJ2_9BACT|nr:RNA polymerase sigma factor [Telmatocola sphagniphila]
MSWLTPTVNINALVDAHYDSLYRFAYRLCGSAADAEDITQDTFCKAQQNLSQLVDVAKVRTWLFRILRNEYLQRVRSQARKNVQTLDNLGEIPSAELKQNLEFTSEELQKALDELPEIYRTPVVLYFFEEFSYREISEQLEVPIGTVMSRLSRAKCFLKNRLEGDDTQKVMPPKAD